MKERTRKNGFTLIEMLVAMAIVVSIVSMVYGSYFATSRSAQAYKAKMNAARSAGDLLCQMTRQIRCSYAKAPESPGTAPGQSLPKTHGILEEPVNYFRGGMDALTGELLHFVTTSRIYSAEDLRHGLIEVIYRFDRTAATLMVSAGRFVETAMPLLEEKEFTTVMEGIEHIDLAFFDGSQWSSEWDYSKTKKLPAAVRISITCKDQNGRKCEYATTARIYCLRKPYGRKKSNIGG